MTNEVKISSKHQITIPTAVFRRLKLAQGDRLLVSVEDGRIVMQPAQSALREVAGSLRLPPALQGKDLDQIIAEAKQARFSV